MLRVGRTSATTAQMFPRFGWASAGERVGRREAMPSYDRNCDDCAVNGFERRCEGSTVKLLLMDTCGVDGSIALADSASSPPVVARTTLGGRTASERLLPELRRLMAAQRWALTDLTAVVVVAGPGSFTGVRVGLAAAKGLCEAGGLPIVMLSRLAVLAHHGGDGAGVTHAVLDAGRTECFYGRFGGEEAPVEALLTTDAALGAVSGGERIVLCEQGVAERFREAPGVTLVSLDASDALELAVGRVERGEFDDVALGEANYLRRTDQEMLARLALRASGS